MKKTLKVIGIFIGLLIILKLIFVGIGILRYGNLTLYQNNNGRSMPSWILTPLIKGDIAYFPSYNGNLYAVDLITKKIRWRFKTIARLWSKPAYADNVIFFTGWDGCIRALDAMSGDLLWSFKSGSLALGTPLIVGNTVYFGSEDNNFYALNRLTGKEIWHFDAQDEIQQEAYPVKNHTTFIGSWDNYLYAIDLNTGKVKWKFKTNDWVRSIPVLSREVIYFGSKDGWVYAANNKDGKEIWRYNTGKEVNNLAISSEAIFVPVKKGLKYFINALNLETGKDLWSFEVSGIRSFFVQNQKLFFVQSKGKEYYLKVLNIDTREIIWTFDETVTPWGPTIKNDRVYIGNKQGVLYGLDIKTGKKVWEYSIEDKNGNGT